MHRLFLIVYFLMCTLFNNYLAAAKPVFNTTVSAISCNGKDDGSLFLEYTCEPAQITNLSLNDSTNKTFLNITLTCDTSFQITNLKPGSYSIQYTFKDKLVKKNITIENKTPLKANVISIRKLSGAGKDILATLEVKPTGGTMPYLIHWSENTKNQQGNIAKDLSQGIYKCIINDSNNCGPVSATFFLFEPEIEKFKQKANTNN